MDEENPPAVANEDDAPQAELKLPPDPEGMNDQRAAWAGAAISAFQIQSYTDFDDALKDLLCDLMHWADRTTFTDGETRIDFEAALTTARMHYEAETSAGNDEPDLFEGLGLEAVPEKMTAEVIAANPAKAVKLPLPPDASAELLSTVYFTAKHLDRVYAEKYEDPEDANTPEKAKEYSDFSRAADARAALAFQRLDEIARRAQEPFTAPAADEPAAYRALLSDDAQLVALRASNPAKVDAAYETLQKLNESETIDHEIEVRKGEYVLVAQSWRYGGSEPLETEVARSPSLEVIFDRLGTIAGSEEIRAMLATEQEYMELAAREAHGYEELPAALTALHDRERREIEHRLDLYPAKAGEFQSLDDFIEATDPLMQQSRIEGRAEILSMVDTLHRQDHTDLPEVEAFHEDLHRDVEHRLVECQPWRGEFSSLNDFMSATDHLALHDLEQQHGAGFTDAGEVMPAARSTNFLSDWFIAKNVGASVLRTAHMVMGAVIGFFVDEPKLTGAQVHDTLQAAGNVETLHARDVAAAAAVDAAEHETRLLAMKGEQQTHDVNLAVQLGTNATAEATLGLDEYEPQRRAQSRSNSI